MRRNPRFPTAQLLPAFLLLVLQLRAIRAMLAPMMAGAIEALCEIASRLGGAALYLYPGVARLPKVRNLICPMLVCISYGLGCRESPRTA